MSDETGFGDGFTPSGVLSLTTDFGVVDGYVGTMKGVALAADPGLSIVDITHLVRPQEVREASFHLRHAVPYFGPGAVHLSVVDPGVGTARESLVALWEGQAFVAPDNGLLPALFAGLAGEVEYGVLDVERFLAPDASRTFHGRDLYSPSAAALASGSARPLDAISRLVAPEECVELDDAEPIVSAAGVRGTIQHLDHFGNAITNIEPAADEEIAAVADRRPRVIVAGVEVGWVETYGEAPDGELVALIDSFGLVEIARVGGSAEATLDLEVGDTVSLELD
ncbi:MAG: SAM-dependent chlorinase/fluorinase [Planctomycetota bacterium]